MFSSERKYFAIMAFEDLTEQEMDALKALVDGVNSDVIKEETIGWFLGTLDKLLPMIYSDMFEEEAWSAFKKLLDNPSKDKQGLDGWR